MSTSVENFELKFLDFMHAVCRENPDPSHDILHVKRVVSIAKKIGKQENANLNIVIPAAYLHDCVYISKSDVRRTQASRLSADKAGSLLIEWCYPNEYIPDICHAIAAHSFSAGIATQTLEAQVVQDADRLDAMGAVGIFRCFAMSGLVSRPFYSENDPFCMSREPDDQHNTLDHFYKKLLHLNKKLNTISAKTEGERRLQTMRVFLESLKNEIEFQH